MKISRGLRTIAGASPLPGSVRFLLGSQQQRAEGAKGAARQPAAARAGGGDSRG